MEALDIWTGEKTALFVIPFNLPDEKWNTWIEFTRTREHIWWKLFGEPITSLKGYQDTSVYQIQKILGKELENEYYYNNLIREIIVKSLCREAIECPCILFFQDLEKSDWYQIKLRQYLAHSEDAQELIRCKGQLHFALQNWFYGPHFKKLLKRSQGAR
jgi:hypothetical protein